MPSVNASVEEVPEMTEAVRNVVGRASGKVILLGEHAVVYGVPALAVGIDRGAQAKILGPAQRSRLEVTGWGITVHDGDEAMDLARAFSALLDATVEGRGGARPQVAVEASADLPPGGGLGCSAALGVAVARALDPQATTAEITARAMAWERIFHGNPSGIDAAVSASGGCVLFEKARGIEPVRVRSSLLLCIGHTGCGSSTKTMVEAVAKRKARSPEVVAKSFEAIGALVRNARLAVEGGDRATLGRLMDLNQMLLGGLFVSTPEIERLCSLARGAGAYGAKLTGAGGGGCVVALVGSHAVAEAVLAAWREENFSGFASRVSGAEWADDGAHQEAPHQGAGP
jgi:mevalonate kinase